MHIEPGIINGAKLMLSYGAACAACGYAAMLVARGAKERGGGAALLIRCFAATALVLTFFEVFPHRAVGVSEVHLILGSTLMLFFGAGPAAVGLAGGLLVQGLFFAPQDLPQYAMNVTTLLLPLFAVNGVAKRIVAPNTAYSDLTYQQALRLSVTYQGGVVLLVAFWVLYGLGVNGKTMSEIGVFAAAYASVVIVEPILDVGLLALARMASRATRGPIFYTRLHTADTAI